MCPIYDYRCQSCEYIQEVIERYIDDAKRTCPKCGHEMTKQIGTSNFILKGTGWYQSDFKNTDKHNKPKKQSS